jgi:pilus assembly protein CpaC
VELTKTYNRVFGFTWAPFIGKDGGQIAVGRGNAGGVTTSSSNALTATISNLFPKLNSAKNAGYARVVESGQVMIREGKPAQIRKTIKTPYVLGNLDSTKSFESTAGFIMSVTPTMYPEEKIGLKITVSINSTVGSSPPTTLENTIDTDIVVKSQESAVLGGVVANKTGTTYDKPQSENTSKDGSPLFSFLKSKEYVTDRSQFVIFVTPEIVESASSGSSEVERKFRKKGR